MEITDSILTLPHSIQNEKNGFRYTLGLVKFFFKKWKKQYFKNRILDKMLECIRLAHSLIDQGSMLFGNVQPLIQVCAELALSSTPK